MVGVLELISVVKTRTKAANSKLENDKVARGSRNSVVVACTWSVETVIDENCGEHEKQDLNFEATKADVGMDGVEHAR